MHRCTNFFASTMCCVLVFFHFQNFLTDSSPQCLLQGNTGDSSDKEFEAEELDDLLLKLKDSVQSDIRQAAVWNTLGLILLRTGRLQVIFFFGQ